MHTLGRNFGNGNVVMIDTIDTIDGYEYSVVIERDYIEIKEIDCRADYTKARKIFDEEILIMRRK